MKHQPTQPQPPEAWLLLADYGNGPKVVGAFPSPDDPRLEAMAKEKFIFNPSVVLDHPSLKVTCYGLGINNPSWLTARDNWFERYAEILEPRLTDPKVSQVFTFEPGKLEDPLMTHKSTANGPFPFPLGKPWPKCGICRNELGFFGVLDFRDYEAVRVPKGSLVTHACTECGVDMHTSQTTWINENEPIAILGDRDTPILVGKRWRATEYPTLAIYSNELVSDGQFLEESSIYFNFSCFANKVGGHVFRIQGHYGDIIPDSNGEPMVYIGQLLDSPDIVIGDCGVAYLYYSPSTGETVMYPESF